MTRRGRAVLTHARECMPEPCPRHMAGSRRSRRCSREVMEANGPKLLAYSLPARQPVFLVPSCADDEEEQELSARAIDEMRATLYTDVAAANGDAERENGGGTATLQRPPLRTPQLHRARKPLPIYYYETKFSLAARATRAESDCNVASPRRRMVIHPAPRAPCRARISWHELDAPVGVARARPTPTSRVYSRRPCGVCDRHAASRKSTVAHHEVKTPPPTSAPAPDPQIHGIASRNHRGAFPHRPVARCTYTARSARHTAPAFFQCSCGRRRDVPDSSGARTSPEPARKMLASARSP
ncbi:hypothetical protein B0H15DRAFT_995606 [Mycena belliarum]|uniref:Uncharacterized protein n=1 Tax=Mycena belliarum TaxID=1033014 RepID=A0AAD6Y0H0_9AGAR|nr:hypothetical protein B0H15DRAFT_995606 [Mycena belliae]